MRVQRTNRLIDIYAVVGRFALITTQCIFYTDGSDDDDDDDGNNSSGLTMPNKTNEFVIKRKKMVISSCEVIFGINSIVNWANALYVVLNEPLYIFVSQMIRKIDNHKIEYICINRALAVERYWQHSGTSITSILMLCNSQPVQSLAIVILKQKCK